MPNVTTTAALLGLMLSTGTFAQTPQPIDLSPAGQLRQATQELEAGRADQAVAALRPLVTDEGAPDAVRYAANLLLHQLDGSFNARQQVWLRRKHVDALVVAGSEQAFADALAGWTDETAFPVTLADNAWWTYLLHRGYGPVAVYRLDSKTELTEEQFVEIATAHNQRLAETERKVPMPGIVVIDPTHEHRLAGLTLAIGRGQPILLVKLDEQIKQADTPEVIAKLNQVIVAAAVQAGVITADHWAGITLAGDFPRTYRDPQSKKPMAVDDALGRDGNGLRLAVVGRFWASREAAIYQAMCSLFLEPKRALLFDDYSNRGGAFTAYRMTEAQTLLAERMRVALVTGKQTTPDALQQLTAADPPFDLVMLNSAGDAMGYGVRGQGTGDDFSIGYPRIYHLIHSFSAQHPQNMRSLAGRALLGGGYWYFGSVDEPFLTAFVRPTGMIAKYLAGTPLAFAARQQPGHPSYRPWKLMLFGDPLLAWRDKPAERIKDGVPEAAQLIAPAEDATIDGWSVGAALMGVPAEDRPTKLADLTTAQIGVMVFSEAHRGRTTRVMDADAAILKNSAIARIVIGKLLADAIATSLATNDLDKTADLLKRWLSYENNSGAIGKQLNRWLAEMAKAGRQAEATLWMEKLEKRSMTWAARRIIARKLAPPAPPAEEQNNKP